MDRRSRGAAGDDLVPSEVGERPYRPVLKKAGLTQAVAFDPVDAADKSAAAATSVDGRQALPAIVLRANSETCGRSATCGAIGLRRSSSWRPRSMVVAIHGRICASAMAHWVGSLPWARGSTASIDLVSARLATSARTRWTQMKPAVPGVRARNVLPARGGADPEPMQQVRLDALRRFARRSAPSPRPITRRPRNGIPACSAPPAHGGGRGCSTRCSSPSTVVGRPVTPEFEQELREFSSAFAWRATTSRSMDRGTWRWISA